MQKKILIAATLTAALFLSPAVYAGDTLLVDDFTRSSFVNLIRGNSGGDEKLPGRCTPGFVWKPELVFGEEGRSLKLDFDVSERNSFSFFWMKLGPEIPGQEGVNQALDLSGYNYLSFWVKGAKGRERFKIELHQDKLVDGRFDFGKDISSFVYISVYLPRGVVKEWQKVIIPLKDFSGITDLSNIIELVFTFENRVGNTQGSVYIDDILFGNAPEEVLQSESLPPSEITLSSPIHVDKNLLNDGYQFSSENKLSIKAPSGRSIPLLEGVRFSYSDDRGNTWKIIETDYNTEDENYEVLWRTTRFPSPGNYQIRAAVADIKGSEVFSEAIKNCTIRSMTTEEFLDLVSKRAFEFFWENQNPNTGLFADASGKADASIGVCGFGLTALAIGAERGWIDKNEAKERALRCIYTFTGDPEDPSRPKAKDKNGFFYHFIDMKTAKRAGKCEISTVDTALLISGALTCGEYFNGEVEKAAELLYSRVEWPKFLYVMPGLDKKLCTMGWAPEKGFLSSCWDYYTDEAIIISLLAIGSPTHPLDKEIFYNWQRRKAGYKKGEPFIYTWHGALFAYQYAHAWFDLDSKVDKEGVNWWENSRRATLASRQFAIDHSDTYRTYGPYSWGITSMDHPEGYTMHYGPTPNGRGQAVHDGTISPSGPAGSIVFTPVLSIKTLINLYYSYPFLWGEHGFRDSFNLDKDWISSTYYGLEEGITLLAIENFRSGFVWNNFMKNKFVRDALSKAGFKEISKEKTKSVFDADSVIGQVEKAKDLKEIADLIEIARLQCETQEDYDKLRNKLLLLKEKPVFQNEALLNYLIAGIYFDQINYMEKIDDLEQGRLYLANVDSFYDEIEKNLSDSVDKIRLRNLSLDAQNLLFITYRNRFKYHESDIAFQKLARLVDEIPGDESAKVKELNRITNQLTREGFGDYALKLRISSIPKLSKASSAEIINELKAQGDLLFEKGDINEAEPVYNQYVDLVSRYSPKESAEKKLTELAEQHFDNGQYKFAIKFYNKGLSSFPQSSLTDYWQFRIAASYREAEDYKTAIENYEYFLKAYPESEYLDEAIRELAILYYTKILSINEAVSSLKSLVSKYPQAGPSDFTQAYIALLYLRLEDYKVAFKEFKSLLYNYPGTALKYSAEKIVKSIERSAEGKQDSKPKMEGAEIWKMYNVGKSIIASLNPVEVTTRPGGVVAFEANAINDEDKYSLYEQDLMDISRLPTMKKVGYEDDMCSLEWSCTKGEFLTEEHGGTKQWRAPKNTGQYEVKITVSDLGLIRVPDKGDRDDKINNVITAVVIVKPAFPMIIPWLLLLILAAGITYVIIKRKKK